MVIDEFGKFLEYAANNEPEKELYFLQQLAEFANNPDINIVLLTTVHQNFDAYALSLTQAQKQEWTKVKGRFREITFNEPVEQLLFLASEHLQQKISVARPQKDISTLVALLIESKAFDVNEKYIADIVSNVYPLDPIAAYVLTQSLQRYGQNERSLFSFLESTDETGLEQYHTHAKTFYSIAAVYEYLVFNFYSFINSRYNPDFSAWKSIKATLEKVESAFEENVNDYFKIVKTIGLLNIHSLAGSTLDSDFLVAYCNHCLGIKNAAELIKNLEAKRFILYRNYSKRYVLFDGTDLDIQMALIEAGGKVDDVKDVVTLLNKYYQLPPVIAKKAMYETGTPRLFEYKISSHPINDVPKGEIDGFVNLVFSESNTLNEVKEQSRQNPEAVLYCYYKNAKTIKELLFEIEKTKKVINENEDDKVAVRELNNIAVHQQNLLTHKILNNFSNNKSEVVWLFQGKEVKIENKKRFNSKLSEICDTVYHKTPVFNNELVNKHKISASIHTAKRNYFKALILNWNQPMLGFDADKFPPEKTIYLSLLENNGIHLYANEIKTDHKPNDKNKFNYIWEQSVAFLDSAKASRRKVSEFVTQLSERPYKLKQGVIDFWVPTFLFIKRDDYALFGEQGYIPYISDEVLDLLVKDPDKFEIKTFAIEGVQLDIFNSYRLVLNQNTKKELSNTNFIETIKPFLTFYKGLPDYSKTTKRVSKEALGIRNTITASKDPEHTFFEAFPLALGYTTADLQQSSNGLNKYVTKLQNAIRELRICYDELINRVEFFIQNDIVGESVPFEEYKESLQDRYKKLRRHLLLPNQRIFVQRLDSQIDDKKAWLNSLAQALINTTLDKMKDEEELVLYDKFKSMILDLDSLTNLSKSDFKEDKEDIFDLQINSFVDGISKKLVRLPKNKKQEVNNIQEAIKKDLSKDKTLNIAALTNLLKEMLKL